MSSQDARLLADEWLPPPTYRQAIADVVRLSDLLVEALQGQMLVRVDELEFMLRRLNGISTEAYRALPTEVY